MQQEESESGGEADGRIKRATQSFSTKVEQCLRKQPLTYPAPVHEVEYRIPMSAGQFASNIERLQDLVGGEGTRKQDTVLYYHTAKNGPVRFCMDEAGEKVHCGTKRSLLQEQLGTKSFGTVLAFVVGVCSAESELEDADLDQSAAAWFERSRGPPSIVGQTVKAEWKHVEAVTGSSSSSDVEHIWPNLQFVSSGKQSDRSLISLPCCVADVHYAFGAVVAKLKPGATLEKVHHGETPKVVPVGVKQRDRTTFKFDSRTTVDCTAFRLNSDPKLYNIEIEFAAGGDNVVPEKLQFLFDGML